MTVTDAAPLVALSDEDVATLNAARRILARLAHEATYDAMGSPDAARVAERAEVAENAVFQVLNRYSVRVRPLTHKQIHGFEKAPA